MSAVCKRVGARTGIPVLPVHSEGFKGTKKDGYRAACEAVFKLIGTGATDGISPHSINILGDFNLAGEIWIIRDYFDAWASRSSPALPAMGASRTSAAATAQR